MRITCPNCAVEYEVDDSAIPAEGRDVQCSACGHGWYQFPPALAAALEAGVWPSGPTGAARAGQGAEAGPDGAGRRVPADSPAAGGGGTGGSGAGDAAGDARLAGDGPVGTGAAVGGPVGTGTRLAAAGPAAAGPAGDGVAEGGAEDGGVDGRSAAAVPRRSLDAAVREVLRSEALREAEARRAEAGLAAPPAEPGEAARGPQAAAAGAAVPERPAGRRKQLPDIDEIDPGLSTARVRPLPAPMAALPPDDDAAARRRGFRLGLLGVLLVAMLAVGLYLLARLQPEAAGMLEAYADAVDRLRLAVAEGIDAALRALTALMTTSDPQG